MPLSASIKLSVSANLTRALDLATAQSPLARSFVQALTDGTAANQADRIYHDQRTLAASGTEDLDLAGSLLDAYGNAFTLARLKALIVLPAAANLNNLNVSRPAANGVPLFLAASDGIVLRPGGMLAWVAGDATGVVVTAGTGDLITFTNAAGTNSVTYDVIMIGASA